MGTWIKCTNPATSAIRIPGLSQTVWLSTTSKAEVSTDVAAVLLRLDDFVETDSTAVGEPRDVAPSHIVEVALQDMVVDTLFASGVDTFGLYFGYRTDLPTDDIVGEGNVALYFKDDQNLYRRPYGEDEVQITGEGSVTDTRVDVSDDGTPVASNVTSIDFGTALSLSESGGVASVDATVTQYTDEMVRDVVAALLDAGVNVSLSVDDAGDALTIAAVDTHTSVSDTSGVVVADTDDVSFSALDAASVSVSADGLGGVEIAIAATNTQLSTGHFNPTYDSAENGTLDAPYDGPSVNASQLTLGAESPISGFAGALSVNASGELVATDTDTQLAAEEVSDIVAALVVGSGAASVSYDDANDRLEIAAVNTQLTDAEVQAVINADTDHGSTAQHEYVPQLTPEQVMDIVGPSFVGSGAASVSYDDANDAVTVDAVDTDTTDHAALDNVQPSQHHEKTVDTHLDLSDDGALVEADVASVDFGANIDAVYDSATDTVMVSSVDTDTQRTNTEIIAAIASAYINPDSIQLAGGAHIYAFTGANLSEVNGSLTATDTHAVTSAVSGSVQLSGGSATVSTGVAEPVQVYLDPSDSGSAISDVDVVASARWDSSAAEIVVEIEEDSTSVGNPTVGYDILTVN